MTEDTYDDRIFYNGFTRESDFNAMISTCMKNNLIPMNKRMKYVVAAIAIFSSLLINVYAGGGPVMKVKIVSFEEKKQSGQYKMVVMVHENTPYSSKKLKKPVKNVLHLRLIKTPNTGRITQEMYAKAIAQLKAHAKKGEQFWLAGMGSTGGMTSLKDKPGEYQSNGLRIHGDMVYLYR